MENISLLNKNYKGKTANVKWPMRYITYNNGVTAMLDRDLTEGQWEIVEIRNDPNNATIFTHKDLHSKKKINAKYLPAQTQLYKNRINNLEKILSMAGIKLTLP